MMPCDQMTDSIHSTSIRIDNIICVDDDDNNNCTSTHDNDYHEYNSTIKAAKTTATTTVIQQLPTVLVLSYTWYPLVGDRVYGNYINNGFWYIGLIRYVHDDLTYDIDYDDGDKEYRIDHGLIRMIKGTRVRSDSYLHRCISNHRSKSCNNDSLKSKGKYSADRDGDKHDSDKWLLGIISKVYKDNTYDIEYDDGDFDVNIDITHIQLLIHSKVIVNNKSCRILNIKNRYDQFNGVVVDDDEGDDSQIRRHDSYNNQYHHDFDYFERRYDVIYEDGSASYNIPISSIRLVGGIIDAVHDCYNTSLSNYIHTSSSSSLSSTITITTTPLNQTNKFIYNQPFITFNNAITHNDVQHIIFLSQCIQHIAPHFHQNRKFGSSDNYNGGNSCVFLGGFMHDILPYLVDKIRAIATHALFHRYDKDNNKVDNDDNDGDNDDGAHYNIDNSFIIPISTLGIRGIEYLQYTEGMALNWHKDHDSIYTMVIMLSSSTAYSGGDFMIKDIYSVPDDTSIHEIKLPYLGRDSSYITFNYSCINEQICRYPSFKAFVHLCIYLFIISIHKSIYIKYIYP